MKLSIITPTHNSAKTIARTIESILLQTNKLSPLFELEYLIIDALSKDNTAEIVSNYKDKLNIKFISEQDEGIYDAMNKGILASSGEIIGILNSDDFYDNDQVLYDVCKKFEETNADMVYGDIVYFGEDINKITRKWSAGIYNEKLLSSGWSIPHPALFVKKEIYTKYGLYNKNYKIAADYEFILRILKIHKVKTEYIPKTFVRMYDSGTSGKNLNQRKLGWKEIKQAWTDNNLKLPSFFVARRLLNKIHQLIFKK